MMEINIEIDWEILEAMGYGGSGKWPDKSMIAGDVENLLWAWLAADQKAKAGEVETYEGGLRKGGAPSPVDPPF